MVSFFNAVQPEKTWLPIDVTEFGMVTEVKPVQRKKASLPIVVTPDIFTEVISDIYKRQGFPLLIAIDPLPLMVSAFVEVLNSQWQSASVAPQLPLVAWACAFVAVIIIVRTAADINIFFIVNKN
jgi:hypothetical protein